MFLSFDSPEYCPLFNNFSRETPIALALEVAADLYEWVLNCEVSVNNFRPTSKSGLLNLPTRF